jgi:hypothetical protein
MLASRTRNGPEYRNRKRVFDIKSLQSSETPRGRRQSRTGHDRMGPVDRNPPAHRSSRRVWFTPPNQRLRVETRKLNGFGVAAEPTTPSCLFKRKSLICQGADSAFFQLVKKPQWSILRALTYARWRDRPSHPAPSWMRWQPVEYRCLLRPAAWPWRRHRRRLRYSRQASFRQKTPCRHCPE